MGFDFDKKIDRRNTNSIKYDFAIERGKPNDVLPLWVADMDFQAPKAVLEAMAASVNHGIFGYTDTKKDYFDVVKNWFKTRFSYQVQYDWLVKVPGVVFALATAVRAFTKENDKILIQRPVYYPFTGVIEINNRILINNPLVCKDGKYQMDFDDFEKKIIENNVKMFILCSPHNPVGRVWSLEELMRIGEVCIRHGVIVVSDEIHADFVYPDFKHRVFASIKPEFADISVICTAPSKTFNLAGLQVSNIFIANSKLRKTFIHEMHKTGFSQLNTLGLVACKAAYESGGEWLEALKAYIQKNLKDVREFLLEHMPNIKLIEPQGTYLIWLDFRGLNLNKEELEKIIVKKARLWLDSGEVFGEEGTGFQRINIACPNEILHEALNRLKEAFKTT